MFRCSIKDVDIWFQIKNEIFFSLGIRLDMVKKCIRLDMVKFRYLVT